MMVYCYSCSMFLSATINLLLGLVYGLNFTIGVSACGKTQCVHTGIGTSWSFTYPWESWNLLSKDQGYHCIVSGKRTKYWESLGTDSPGTVGHSLAHVVFRGSAIIALWYHPVASCGLAIPGHFRVSSSLAHKVAPTQGTSAPSHSPLPPQPGWAFHLLQSQNLHSIPRDSPCLSWALHIYLSQYSSHYKKIYCKCGMIFKKQAVFIHPCIPNGTASPRKWLTFIKQ